MPIITLNIPTLVKTTPIDGHDHFHLRPLFFNHPVATHRRYANAESRYKKELKTYFRGFQFSQENAPRLFWYLFAPDLDYQIYNLSFQVNKQFVKGSFGIASFSLKNQVYVTLPYFHNFMFIVRKDEEGNFNIKEQATEVIRKLFIEYKREDGSDFDISRYFSHKKEFVKKIQQNVRIGNSKFKFESTTEDYWYSKVSKQSEFDGSVEIERVAENLNEKYPESLNRAYYRDDLVNQIFKIIFQNENTPIVIIGEKGVGKHTLIEEILYRYLDNYVQEGKSRKEKIWLLNPNRIIAGMSIVGMWEKRFEAILKYIQKPNPNALKGDKILIDNPIALLRIGKSASNALTLAHVLKPYLEKRTIQITLLSTPNEWKIIQEQNRGFSDLFQVLRVNEPSLDTSVKIVLEKRKILEIENDCEINIQAIHQLFTIHRNYLKNNPLPGSVMKLLTQLATKYKFKSIDAPEVRQEFKTYSGLKEQIFDEHSLLNKEEVINDIGQDLVGQSDAVETLTEVIHLIKAKLSEPKRPHGSYLFIGPTGVGKTQAVKILCRYLMGSEENLLRFDMNEFIDEFSIDRLIGNHHNPEGILTSKIRYKPFGVVLLDEIEKAHPKVHDLLLQVLDDGRLTDSLGRTVDFTNTIIVMTSNVGAREVSLQLGFATQSRDPIAVYRKALEKQFKPEFLNRIDKIVAFNPLGLDHILSIARLQIKELLSRDGFVRRTTILNISHDALEWVAKRGFDEKMGGRALKRQIERDLTMLSAEQLINTSNKNPILLDINLEDGKLIPQITPLNFVARLDNEWLPTLPDETQGRKFYNKLIYTVEELERKIMKFEEYNNISPSDIIIINEKSNDDLNWQYYDFKNKLLDVKDRLKTIRLGFSERYFREAPALPLRLKLGTLYPRKDWSTKGVRENYKDRLFQKEALKEVSEAYELAPQQFDSIKTEFIDNFLNVAFLKLFSKGFLREQIDKVSLQFESCIVGMGKKEIEFLLEKYAQLLNNLEISYQVEKEKNLIQAEGHSLYQLLWGEEGIHLFYKAYQNPLPIKLILKKEGRRAKKSLKSFKVIRIYDGKNTLTDLRTGFSNDVNITVDEFKLLLFAGIPKDIRNSLNLF